jgi:hypothetical protein
VFPSFPIKFKRVYSSFEYDLILSQIVHCPLPQTTRYSTPFLRRILQFMAERLHIFIRKYPHIEAYSNSIWKTFLSLLSLLLYPKSDSSDLVVLGSQISLESNQLYQTQPKMENRCISPTLPPKSKSVNKSDFPKSFLKNYSSNKISQLMHPSLSLDCFLFASITTSLPNNTPPSEELFESYKYK